MWPHSVFMGCLAGEEVVATAFHAAAEACPTSTLWMDESLDCADEVCVEHKTPFVLS